MLFFILILPFFVFGQSLRLHISVKDSSNAIFQSLAYKKEHPNAKSIQEALLKTNKYLEHLGYLNYTKKQDSIVANHFYYSYILNKAIDSLYIIVSKKQDSLIHGVDPTIAIKNNQIQLPFQQSDAFLTKLKNKYEAEGYAFATLRLKDISIKANIAYASLAIETNKKRTIDTIVLKGYTDFPKAFIQYYLKLPSAKPLNKEQVKNIAAKINKLPFAASIKPAELLFTKDDTALYLYLKKQQANSFQGIIGISARENKKTAIYGYIQLHLNNLFNRGTSLAIDWNKTAQTAQSLHIKTALPYIFNTPLSVKLQSDIKKIDSTYTKNQLSLALYLKKDSNTIGVGIANANKSSNNFTALNKKSIYAYYTFKKKSSIAVFNNSHFLNINIKHSIVKQASSTSNKNTIQLEYQKLVRLSRKNYLAVVHRSSYSTTAMLNDEDVLGGITSLKAFDENQFFVNNYGILTLEQRYLISNTIYSSINMQMSYLENNNSHFNTLSFGLALNLKQENGLLTLAYNLGKTNNYAFKLANSKLNITFLTFF